MKNKKVLFFVFVFFGSSPAVTVFIGECMYNLNDQNIIDDNQWWNQFFLYGTPIVFLISSHYSVIKMIDHRYDMISTFNFRLLLAKYTRRIVTIFSTIALKTCPAYNSTNKKSIVIDHPPPFFFRKFEYNGMLAGRGPQREPKSHRNSTSHSGENDDYLTTS